MHLLQKLGLARPDLTGVLVFSINQTAQISTSDLTGVPAFSIRMLNMLSLSWAKVAAGETLGMQTLICNICILKSVGGGCRLAAGRALRGQTAEMPFLCCTYCFLSRK